MQALICDSCEKPIVNRNQRVQVVLFTEEPIADPPLDLCSECGDDVIKSKKVKQGQAKAKERIKKWMPPVVPHNPTGDPVDDYQPHVGDGPAETEKLRGDVTADEAPA